MESEDSPPQNDSSIKDVPVGKLFLPSLVLSRFSTTPSVVILSLLLIEIGATFGLPVAVVGQLGTASSASAFISSLVMGILSVRYKQKTLLSTGLLFLGASILGCYLSPIFSLLLIFNVLIGYSNAMIMPMTTSLVARHLPLEKRTSAIGLLMATLSVSYLVGTVIIQYLSSVGGWRLPFLIYALPLPIISLLIVSRGLPAEPEIRATSGFDNLMIGYRSVLSNKSALACLVSNALAGATFSGISLYSISFYREYFMLSMETATYLLVAMALIYTFGSLISGRFVKKTGRKKVTYTAAFLGGIFALAFTVVPNLWLSIVMTSLACLFSGLRNTAHVSLVIEQVPEYRGTTMSLSAAFINLGTALGSGLAGLSILWYGYLAIGPTLGFFGLIAAFIVYFIAVDPTQTSV